MDCKEEFCTSENQRRIRYASSSFADTEEEQWRKLKEEAMIDSDEESPVESGLLDLPAGPKKRRAKRMEKAVVNTQKSVKVQQHKLNHPLSAPDMENLLKKYRSASAEEEEGDVDFSKFLQDDDLESEKDDENEEVNADEFFATLTAGKNDISTHKLISDEPESIHHVGLDDEVFVYEDAKDPAKIPQRKSRVENNSETNYMVEKNESKEVNLIDSLPTDVRASPLCVSSELPKDCQSSGLFYWFDAKEQSHTLSEPGSIFLFGKLCTEDGNKMRNASCCVRVQNVYRSTFLLPKKGSSDSDVVHEINAVCRSFGIEERRIKFVDRYYAFEEAGIGHEKLRWAKLRFPGRYPPFPSKRQFTHIRVVIGASRSLLELFLIKKKIMGPAYMRIEKLVPSATRISHCEVEFCTDSPKNIKIDNVAKIPPPFTLVSIQLHTQLDAKGATNEVVAASIAVYRDVNIDGTMKSVVSECMTGVRPLSTDAILPMDLESFCQSKRMPGVQKFSNERALLTWIAATLGDLDPDMITGHNFLGYTVDILLNRYQELNVPRWSTIGRLDLKRFPRSQSNSSILSNEREVCVGRLVVDTYSLSKEYYKSANYKLLSLKTQMGLCGITDVNGTFEPGSTILDKNSMSSSKELFPILLQLLNCAVLSVRVAAHLDVIPLTKRLTSLAGNLWSRTLHGARSERIEYLLLHAFHNLKFVIPDRKVYDAKRSRQDAEDETKHKAKYQGGMVLEPRSGLYSDYILLLDFNSLYPSLIQEFNICFTTIERDENTVSAEVPPPENLICSSCAEVGSPSPCSHRCVLPKVIKSLVDSRREIKRIQKAEKDPGSIAILEIRQKALKLTANSIYGCLGFEHSRFYAQPLAELVTRQGRLALQNTVELIPQISPTLRVIYGDTDSVMIQTGIKDDIRKVRDIGFDIKNKVNQRYQSLELDIDGVFRAMLLLKKKKYAALSVVDWQGDGTTYKKEVKGLDMVRRDWCPLSQKVSEAVLGRVLNAEGGEDILDYVMAYMKDVSEHTRLGDRYPLEDFVISKGLMKEPESYRGTSFPHATVALRMKQRKENVRVGDLIPYVMCESSDSKDKAYHFDEVRMSNGTLRVDIEWYLSSQLYPPVARLCEHIQGFSPEQLSEAMGIACHENVERAREDAYTLDDFSHFSLFKSRELSECFPTAIALQAQCSHCRQVVPVDPHKYINDKFLDKSRPFPTEPFEVYLCVNCGKSLPLTYLANCLTQMCHKVLHQFYRSGGGPTAVRAVRAQFTYFRALFDVPHAPGCHPIIKDAHRVLALRCLGTDRKLYTLADANRFTEVEPVDPLFQCAESFYRRVDHLFVNLDRIFGS